MPPKKSNLKHSKPTARLAKKSVGAGTPISVNKVPAEHASAAAVPSGGTVAPTFSTASTAVTTLSAKTKSSATATTADRTAAATAKTELCAICCQKIVDGKEDALFCEGSCKRWCHRYCVGVPLKHFRSLAASPSQPFICPTCYQSVYEQEVSTLKSSIALLKEEVQGLKAEVKRLNGDHQSLEGKKTKSAHTFEPSGSLSSGSGVGGRRGRRGVGGGGRGGHGGHSGQGRGRVDGGAGERLGSMDAHAKRSAYGGVGEKGRVVAGGGGHRVDGVGGVTRKGVMGKI